jgi:predicted O-linked N-acetylglucosamine transferase (SPINDLY family)
LPVVTLIGETFVGRVAASLLRAIGLPELITTSSDGYQQLAIALAKDPAKLSAIKARLGRYRLTMPLFDTERFARNMEAAYIEMHRRHQAGLQPDHFAIPN